MQRRLVALAPLLAVLLLLHVAVTCRPTLDPTTTPAAVPRNTQVDQEVAGPSEFHRGADLLVDAAGPGVGGGTAWGVRDLLGRGAAVVSRTGRHQQAVERREPVAPESCHACGAPSRRRHAPHGRPLTADVAPGPLRVSVLRC